MKTILSSMMVFMLGIVTIQANNNEPVVKKAEKVEAVTMSYDYSMEAESTQVLLTNAEVYSTAMLNLEILNTPCPDDSLDCPDNFGRGDDEGSSGGDPGTLVCLYFWGPFCFYL